ARGREGVGISDGRVWIAGAGVLSETGTVRGAWVGHGAGGGPTAAGPAAGRRVSESGASQSSPHSSFRHASHQTQHRIAAGSRGKSRQTDAAPRMNNPPCQHARPIWPVQSPAALSRLIFPPPRAAPPVPPPIAAAPPAPPRAAPSPPPDTRRRERTSRPASSEQTPAPA